MNYAVVKIGGKQYKVSVGDVLEVSKLNFDKNKKIEFEEILFVSEDGKVKVGNPTIKNAKIKAVLLADKKGEKTRVAKFKSKVRYRKVMGFRPLISQIRIEKIEF